MGRNSRSTVTWKKPSWHTATRRARAWLTRCHAKDITVTQDETFTGGLCLVGMEPVSNYILLEQAAQARDQDTWQA